MLFFSIRSALVLCMKTSQHNWSRRMKSTTAECTSQTNTWYLFIPPYSRFSPENRSISMMLLSVPVTQCFLVCGHYAFYFWNILCFLGSWLFLHLLLSLFQSVFSSLWFNELYFLYFLFYFISLSSCVHCVQFCCPCVVMLDLFPLCCHLLSILSLLCVCI